MQSIQCLRSGMVVGRPTPLLVALLSVSLWLVALTMPAGAAPSHKLVGKWQAEAMEVDGKRYPVKPPMNIVFEYQKGGKLIVTISLKDESKRHEGTWKAEGKQLTMSADGKTETMTFTITGSQLRMEKIMAGKSTVHYMKRLR